MRRPTAPDLPVLAGFAGPHGYTLVVWFSTAQAAAAHGLPDLSRSLAFVGGCLAAVAAVSLLVAAPSVGRRSPPRSRSAAGPPPWSLLAHGGVVGGCALLGWGAGRLGDGSVTWFGMGAVVTGGYLAGLLLRTRCRTRRAP
ncbi:hypothetical protein GCM10009788_09260 [Nocardioides humi]|uniref:Uncharacterized protein n=1 Tax=Nocardioides humi TaxID=449461 RepID=A0ABN1ZYD3_9ACTN